MWLLWCTSGWWTSWHLPEQKHWCAIEVNLNISNRKLALTLNYIARNIRRAIAKQFELPILKSYCWFKLIFTETKYDLIEPPQYCRIRLHIMPLADIQIPKYPKQKWNVIDQHPSQKLTQPSLINVYLQLKNTHTKHEFLKPYNFKYRKSNLTIIWIWNMIELIYYDICKLFTR